MDQTPSPAADKDHLRPTASFRRQKQIVDLGIRDPDLFVAMGLFEDGIGPDMISDMATNVILPDLLTFNARILEQLKIPTSKVTIRLKSGTSYDAELPRHPFIAGEQSPILLVPADILRDLPIASDWSDVADAAAKNSEMRDRVNQQIAEIWCLKSKKEKDKARHFALGSEENFVAYLDLLRRAKGKPYDFADDPLGELVWRHVLDTIATEQPFALADPPAPTVENVAAIVSTIIEQFRFLIEQRRLSEDLYHGCESHGQISAVMASRSHRIAVITRICGEGELLNKRSKPNARYTDYPPTGSLPGVSYTGRAER
jgi:hypothetical protein